MLEVAVGVLAVALVAAGLAIMAGPALPRFWDAAWTLAARSRRKAAAPLSRLPVPVSAPARGEPALHPTTSRALGTAARVYSLLRASGEDRVAFELRAAARLVRSDEAQGLLALAGALRSMRDVALRDEEAEQRYRRLLQELREAVKDRSEQLELLHFPQR